MTIDSDLVEGVFGASAFAQLLNIVDQQITLNKQRLEQVLTVRQVCTLRTGLGASADCLTGMYANVASS